MNNLLLLRGFLLLAVFAAFVSVPYAFAGEEVVAASRLYVGIIGLGLVFGMGIAALGVGIGMGIATKGATEGTARNPGASSKIMVTQIIGLALMESVAIFTLLIALIILFVDPLGFAS
ncbi:ATP synthase F0 subunit C [Thermodesulfovibrionales bacterium]|nr:ATP synthase F0 subunit C [Thermodesulfovibrionales bacterium]MCL0071232.1 ATP synthase F0 subunit C [Thermodesulfovibrionales bacterium]MCL0071241.1 ATP synthase F0 subunit C [Thermodesulfovibrionales bacterium]